MAGNQQNIAQMRCPVCFAREIDVLLLHDGTEYYCVKCSYRGSVGDVRAAYQPLRSKYVNRTTRIDFDRIERL